jgi:N utilization substance protein A
MSKKVLNVLDVVKVVSYEMEISEEVIFGAIEAALETITKKKYLTELDVKVVIDRKTGNYNTYRLWTVVDDNLSDVSVNGEPEKEGVPAFDPNRHIRLTAAKQHKNANDAIKVGDVIREPIESIDFGRIAARTAKQVIMQKVKEAKRAQIVAAYKGKENQLLRGSVKKTSREGVVIDLGDAEAFIPSEEMISGEILHTGSRVRAYLYEIVSKSNAKGPQLLMSRARKEMLRELLQIEVPEIGEEIIEIKAIAREPGVRSKVAVQSKDGRIDPVGACVGMRGSRIQTISNELNGERIDVILWDENPAQLAINALIPAEVSSIVMDEDSKTMDIAVDESQLAQAIGRGGQNVRLASEITGWSLNVMSIEEAKEKSQGESERIIKTFMETLDVDSTIAEMLVEEGFTSLEEIAYVPIQELLSIEAFNEEIVNALRERAKASIEAKTNVTEPEEDLLALEGMEKDMAYALATHHILTREDLAECSTDELIDMHINGLTREKAGQLIMKAREHWFQ